MGLGHPTPPRRVLAIDDDPVSLALTGVLLEAEGCEVLQAHSGEQALDQISAGAAPDCILADLQMPTLAGSDLARLLRQAAPGALLLAMSASPPTTLLGYDWVLRKPLSPEALHDAFACLPPDAARNALDPADPAKVLDLAVLDRLDQVMSANALREVVSTFLSDTRSRVEQMQNADAETLRRQAHTIKGGAAMVGAVQISAVASAIETGIDYCGDRRQKLEELESCLRRAEVILKGRLKI
jgi:CheY-like chemotaxis protein